MVEIGVGYPLYDGGRWTTNCEPVEVVVASSSSVFAIDAQKARVIWVALSVGVKIGVYWLVFPVFDKISPLTFIFFFPAFKIMNLSNLCISYRSLEMCQQLGFPFLFANLLISCG